MHWWVLAGISNVYWGATQPSNWMAQKVVQSGNSEDLAGNVGKGKARGVI